MLYISHFAVVNGGSGIFTGTWNQRVSKNTRDDLSAIATIIGNRSNAALLFHDQKLAEENLAVINILPEVQAACVYNAEGKMFAALLKNEATE